MRSGKRVFLVAAEESGDRLGAALIEAVRARAGTDVEFIGVGGHAMAAQGVSSLFPIDELAIVGLGIVGKLPLILRRIRQTAAAVVAVRPDILVIVDSPDFTHRVARRVRAAAPSMPIVDYVSPTVWAWRPGRARAMRAYVDHILALLPFEPAVHAELGGPPCSFVGHPMSERVGSLRPDEREARRRRADPPLVLMLPGSRRGEIRRMQATFAEAMERLETRAGAIDLVVPTVPHLAGDIRGAASAWRVRPRIVIDPAEKQVAFRTARAALAKSGTVTLELALAGVPMVAAYKVSALEAFVARHMIRVPSVILANLVLGENIVPEYLQGECTPDALADAMLPLLSNTPLRRRQIEAFARLDAIMQIGSARPSDRAAEIVLEIAARGRR
ncbi:MAG: lipid-A-disaccharide synthase [Rhizobiales bacterium]|nr:lipid-A-disaccharide synthase [Hyphomicrobiales bacterium]